ncbi:hypothetical protein B0J13DRAFT_454378 [Dactylonectria estremocensis]|uniref:Protein kinase domain-containing protein n=1 Tax=Dactylonectria estremocensis TaxID=1079267 RepID=A0A9P9IN10_9HYPO|nr:hypothetical protein B0J13DRAFT_454378 [Dactylonectria estremocensis]
MGIQQQRSQILGLADAFRVRLTNLLPDDKFTLLTIGKGLNPSVLLAPTPPESLSVEKHPQWPTPILVEWKVFEDPVFKDEDIKRISRLVKALQAASTGHFRTPKCLGYLLPSTESHAKCGLVFQAPSEESMPVTLYTLLREQQAQAGRKVNIPTLGERFRLAFEIAQALMRWHLAGWVHQGIASFNVVFFKTSPNTVDYSRPYLVGFDYSRENDASSTRRRCDQAESEAIRDLYQHPERQGAAPPKKHQRKHDLYALGLVLIEIGRWTQLGDIFRNIISKKGGPSLVPDAARKLTERVLSHNMGTAYRDATAASLLGDLGVKEDDEYGTRFIANFESQVVHRLEVGLKLDE